MFICCYLVNLLKLSSIKDVILKVFVGGIVYIMALLVLKDEFLNEIINKILKKIKGEVK